MSAPRSQIYKDKGIHLIRGDSYSFTIEAEDEEGNSLLVDGATIYCTVKVNTRVKEKILQKVITAFPNNKAVIEILPQDTKECAYGSYVYDVQLTEANGKVTTLIGPIDFIILGEVTFE